MELFFFFLQSGGGGVGGGLQDVTVWIARHAEMQKRIIILRKRKWFLSLLPARRKVMRWDKVELEVAIVWASSSAGLPLN